VVLDTNVVVSGLLFGGVPGRIRTAWTSGAVCSRSLTAGTRRVSAGRPSARSGPGAARRGGGCAAGIGRGARDGDRCPSAQGGESFAACAKDSGHVNETIAATDGTPSREPSARQRGVVDADGYAIVTKGAAAQRSGNDEGSGDHTKSFRKPARKAHGLIGAGISLRGTRLLPKK